MKRLMAYLFVLLGLAMTAEAQRFALKTDLTNWATASLNLEPEVRIGKKQTLALGLSYNAWQYRDNKKWKHFRVQPEYRYWLCREFSGHFFGLHASYTHFNTGNVDLPFNLFSRLENERVQGNEYAVGIGYGYHWILTPRWSIEAEVGIGFSHACFDAYECQKCGDLIAGDHTNRFLPTKLAVSFIYMIK